ncbi:MAG: modification methylase [Candidatus Omnitrophica bacterium CG12_big_fil_rev_8_21_14_0_65_42_8]|nr:MAG: modification methylase [Candidatus Omnitrophica bacterium CG12_big_fil_rev_8_21_14_0_65_42_8]
MKENNIQARPFLKWAGGKGQLLEQFQFRFPQELNGKGIIKQYYEPFLGSGAVFFWVMRNCKIKKAYINEFNSEIYLCYVAIQKNVEMVIDYLEILEKKYHGLGSVNQESFYYRIRNKYNQTRRRVNYKKYSMKEYSECAAMIIFLNRTCFNGLYRVNSKGDFNVPFGRYKNPAICNIKNLRAVSRVLKNVIITNDDFAVVQKQVKQRSFVYFDPPYRPLNKTSSFTSYSHNDFDDKEQERLAAVFKKLSQIDGVRIMLSNSDPKNEDKKDNFFERLYSDFKIERLKARRMINCDASKRGEINELLVTNY